MKNALKIIPILFVCLTSSSESLHLIFEPQEEGLDTLRKNIADFIEKEENLSALTPQEKDLLRRFKISFNYGETLGDLYASLLTKDDYLSYACWRLAKQAVQAGDLEPEVFDDHYGWLLFIAEHQGIVKAHYSQTAFCCPEALNCLYRAYLAYDKEYGLHLFDIAQQAVEKGTLRQETFADHCNWLLYLDNH